jgi:glycosyltransferase involved in cell wall biosynthesis
VGAIRSKAVVRLLGALELRLYNDAAAVVAVTGAFREYLVGRGVDAAKITVIPNGIDFEAWDGTDAKQARAHFHPDSKFVVSYVGTHGMAHNLETLLEAAKMLRDDADIQFVTVGDGAELKKLQRIRDEWHLANVTLVGQVSHETAKAYLLASDVSVVLLRKTPLFKTVLPSKIFEAMAAQSPIILGVDGEARRIVEEAGAGICVEPENARQLAAAILRLKSDAALRRRLGENGLRAARDKFDRKVMAVRMLEVMGAARGRGGKTVGTSPAEES